MSSLDSTKYSKLVDLDTESTSKLCTNSRSEEISLNLPFDDDKQNEKATGDSSHFLGIINIACLRTEFQFLVLAAICFFGFWLCGYIEELIFGENKFECGWFLATFELSFFCLITSIASIWTHIPTLMTILRKEQQQRSSALCDFLKVTFTSRAPLSIHCIMGLAMTFARSLTLFSLVYLNYPTQ